MPFLPPNQQRQSTKDTVRRHRIDTYLGTLLVNQTARKALPQTIAKSGNRKLADCPSYY